MRHFISFLIFFVLFFPFFNLFAQDGKSNPDLGFKENKGQWHHGYKYRYRQGSFFVFLEPQGWFYYLTPPSQGHDHQEVSDYAVAPSSEQTAPFSHGIRLSFVSAATPSLTANRPHKAYYNYFLGSDADRWASRVRSFRSVWYCDMYDYVDVEIQSGPQGVKYNLTVYPGGDLESIGMNIAGANGVYVLKNKLYIETAYGNLVEQIPLAYQLAGDQTIPLRCSYYLKDENTVGFSVEGYDPTRTLVIDPEVFSATLSGSTADNKGYSACPDAEGNMYVSGVIHGENTGAGTALVGYQPYYAVQRPNVATLADFGDICVAKFNVDLSDLLFFTYLGGDNREAPFSTLVDEENNFYLFGRTESATSFPVLPGAYQVQHANVGDFLGQGDLGWVPSDLVLVRMSSDGASLLGSTYLGGTGWDGGWETGRYFWPFYPYIDANHIHYALGQIAIDPVDKAILGVSYTNSTDFPSTFLLPGAGGGLLDAVVFKMNKELTSLAWSSYIGGSSYDVGTSIVASEKNIYITGHTTSRGFTPDTIYQHDTFRSDIAVRSDIQDAFLVSIPRSSILGDSFVKDRMKVRFFGGGNHDRAYHLQLDKLGNVYMMGQTHGGYPTSNTDGRFHQPNMGHFIHKLSADLETTDWAITFGASVAQPAIYPTAFLVDDCFRIHVAGWGGGNNRYSYLTENRPSRLGVGAPIRPPPPTTTTGGGFPTSPFSPAGQHPPGLSNYSATAGAPLRSWSPDGNDFYFMILSGNAKERLYASFFGGENLPDHTDGGSSYYSSDGTMYQAVCACFGGRRYGLGELDSREYPASSFHINARLNDFPATPNAYAALPGLPVGCNMGGFKFKADFDQDTPLYTSDVLKDGEVGVRGGCAPMYVSLAPIVSFIGTNVWKVRRKMERNPETLEVIGAVPQVGLDGELGLLAKSTDKNFSYVFTEEGTYTITLEISGRRSIYDCEETHVYEERFVVRDPKVEVPEEIVVCEGEGAVTLSADHATATSSFGYVWTPQTHIQGENHKAVVETISLSAGTTAFNLEFVAGFCTVKKRVLVSVLQKPTVDFHDVGRELSSCDNSGSVSFSANVSHADYFHWDMGDNISTKVYENRAFIEHAYSKPGTYQVRLVAGNQGCVSERFRAVRTSAGNFPNVFTPNGDGVNDYFELPGVINSVGETYPLSIYDRLGGLVYATQSYDNKWEADDLPSGVYFYSLTVPSANEICKGWVHVIK